MSKVKQNDVEYDAQGVALSIPYSAAEAPRGPVGPQPARATFASPGDAGVSGFVGCPEDPEVSGTSHEIYCGCPDCSPDTSECSGCGETCDDEFCFCHPTCSVCDDDSYVDLALEQFTFTITPEDLPHGDYQDCWNPDVYMAFWDDDILIVADTQSDARWRVVNYEEQDRAASRPYYTWFCERIGVTDPCDESFMKSISS